jgi:pyruvate ferredoxin oxidoreductase delta subunit
MSKPTTVVFHYPTDKTEMPEGPYAIAGVLVETNAGWRSVRPIIADDKCVQCDKCWLICPDGAIDRIEKSYTVDYDFCKGCGLCACECPTKAIRMIGEGEAE